MPPLFLRAYPPAEPSPGPALWLPFRAGELLVRERGEEIAPARGDPSALGPLADAVGPGPPLFLGALNGTPYLTCEVAADAALPPGWRAVALRELFGRLDDATYALAGYASQVLGWRRTSRFCPVCGRSTAVVPGTWGRTCPGCGHTRYPPLSPAVLVLVHDGDRVLLAQKPGWGKRYSLIAGFVEPGESLEECARREVFEEVGIEVDAPVYAGSQPWPFPHQVMIAFLARYTGGAMLIEAAELADAAWFSFDALPELPGPLSLSRQTIDAWVAARRAARAGEVA